MIDPRIAQIVQQVWDALDYTAQHHNDMLHADVLTARSAFNGSAELPQPLRDEAVEPALEAYAEWLTEDYAASREPGATTTPHPEVHALFIAADAYTETIAPPRDPARVQAARDRHPAGKDLR